MKNLSALLLACVFLSGIGSISAADETPFAYEYKQPKETKKEINAKKLLEEIKLDIIENHNGATIVKAYETFLDGKKNGYEVEIEQGPRKATLTYDLKGNPENRITPLKI